MAPLARLTGNKSILQGSSEKQNYANDRWIDVKSGTILTHNCYLFCLQKLIALGGDSVGVTAHKEELQFLTSVCSKLENDSSLIVHVLEVYTLVEGITLCIEVDIPN